MFNQSLIGQTEILKSLRSEGFRLTLARRSIVDLLSDTDIPLSLNDIRRNLKQRSVRADRTTIYREILFLKKKKIIHEIPLGDGKRRYKICPCHHHHHLICIRCNRTEDIIFQKELIQQEREISKRKNFKVLSHSLEFYGLCIECQ